MTWPAGANNLVRVAAFYACSLVVFGTHAWATTPAEYAAAVVKAEAHLTRFEVEEARSTLEELYFAQWACAGAEPFLRLRGEVLDARGSVEGYRDLVACLLGRGARAEAREVLWLLQAAEARLGDSAGQVTSLRQFIGTFGRGSTAAPEAFAAMASLADVLHQRGEKAAAMSTWRQIVARFATAGLKKDGGAAATVAAGAAFRVLEPHYEELMGRKLQFRSDFPRVERCHDLGAQVGRWHAALFGPLRPASDEVFRRLQDTPGDAPLSTWQVHKQCPYPSGAFHCFSFASRCGYCPPASRECAYHFCKGRSSELGLLKRFQSEIQPYNSVEWTARADLAAAKMLARFARVIHDAEDIYEEICAPYPPEVGSDEFLEHPGARIENMALDILTRLAEAIETTNAIAPWTAEVRAEVSRYKPKDFPVFRAEMYDLRLGPVQSEAAALATLRANPESQAARLEVLLAMAAGPAFALRHLGRTPPGLNPADQGRLHNLLGVLAARGDQWVTARQEFEAALAVRPDDLDVRNNLAVAWTLARRGDKALAVLTPVADSQRGALDFVTLGNAWRVAKDYAVRGPNALRAYEAALKLNPKLPQALFNLGLLYLERSDISTLDDETRVAKALGLLHAAVLVMPEKARPGDFETTLGDAVRLLMQERRKRENAERAVLEAEKARATRNRPSLLPGAPTPTGEQPYKIAPLQ